MSYPPQPYPEKASEPIPAHPGHPQVALGQPQVGTNSYMVNHQPQAIPTMQIGGNRNAKNLPFENDGRKWSHGLFDCLGDCGTCTGVHYDIVCLLLTDLIRPVFLLLSVHSIWPKQAASRLPQLNGCSRPRAWRIRGQHRLSSSLPPSQRRCLLDSTGMFSFHSRRLFLLTLTILDASACVYKESLSYQRRHSWGLLCCILVHAVRAYPRV